MLYANWELCLKDIELWYAMVPFFEEPIKDEAPTRDIRTEDTPKPQTPTADIKISSSLENVTDVEMDD